jgi:KaiC/GvpD/RAD55 family RecA-like ATPase
MGTDKEKLGDARYIGFGIPSLDRLLGQAAAPQDRSGDAPFGFRLQNAAESTTFCLIGPDGTGKSIFALHLASEYWRRVHSNKERTGKSPKILYASTDLSTQRAQEVWKSFWLHRPQTRNRRMPFQRESVEACEPMNEVEKGEWASKGQLILQAFEPVERSRKSNVPSGTAYSIRDFSRFIGTDEFPGNDAAGLIAFLDLESTTAGDDWGLLNTILAELDTPGPDEPRHLMVIDAIEGLETLVGDHDAFGERQDRRTRIAHIVRAAHEKCHLVFVVEESKTDERLPEVFVSDVVIKLRTTLDRDYSRRTLECEKVRGQPHVRGQHDFRIRRGPSFTGQQVLGNVNADEPFAGISTLKLPGDEVPREDCMSYIQVFPTLHTLSRGEPGVEASSDEDEVAADWRYAQFGIHQLDGMLAHAGNETGEVNGQSVIAGHDRQGLRAGSVTTLIGNEATYKSQLARAFLSQCFRTRIDATGVPFDPSARRVWVEVLANANDPISGQGVAILLTTADTDRGRLLQQLSKHLIVPPKLDLLLKKFENEDWLIGIKSEAGATQQEIEQLTGMLSKGRLELSDVWKERREVLEKRVIVRRLETHHLPSSVLMHIVQQNIEAAKRKLREAVSFKGEPKEWRQKYAWRIRFVLDDWTTLMSTFPEVQRDTLFVRALMSYLRREGVTALVLATLHGGPSQVATDEFRHDRDIRELRVYADNHLNTWHVPFYGERRVAITSLPGMSRDQESHVRELRRATLEESHRITSRKQHKVGIPSLEQADDEQVVHPETLIVDPHFELYKGLEEGKAEPVSLQVRLYAEDQKIQAFQGYLAEITQLFHHMFGHDNRQTVLQPQYGTSYDVLRELSYLQSEARLDHTLVIQADEFWAESRSELRRQERYINARTVDRDGTRVRVEDPFALFQINESTKKMHEGRPVRRRDFYEVVGYDMPACTKRFPIHKVPYSWDFGFLLCNKEAWERAATEEGWCNDPWRGDKVKGLTVGQIWGRLWKIDTVQDRDRSLEAHFTRPPASQDPKGTPELVKDPAKETLDDVVSWREFFGACKTVANLSSGHRAGFDIDLLAVETLSCLVLEVWLSEWYRAECYSTQEAAFQQLKDMKDEARHDALKKLFQSDPEDLADPADRTAMGVLARTMFRHFREQSLSLSIRDRLVNKPGQPNPFRTALYRAFLLLHEVTGPAQFKHNNNELIPRPAARDVVAARHWYSTASAAMNEPGERPTLIPVGLPGHLSTRGDWFMGVARGSRSARLGERAMDILCSRRSNITRLQTGLGLPVRDIFPPLVGGKGAAPQQRNEYRTALRPSLVHDGVSGELDGPIMYPHLRNLGGYDPRDGLGRQAPFFWLWRSTLQVYDLHARIWVKWLCSMMQRWRTWPRDTKFTDGLAEYDDWVAARMSGRVEKSSVFDAERNVRWARFNSKCDALIETLDRACPVPDS